MKFTFRMRVGCHSATVKNYNYLDSTCELHRVCYPPPKFRPLQIKLISLIFNFMKLKNRYKNNIPKIHKDEHSVLETLI